MFQFNIVKAPVCVNAVRDATIMKHVLQCGEIWNAN